MSAHKIPNRTRKPDSYDYIIFDKDDFVNFTDAVGAILRKQLGYAQRVVIRVDGFDDSFESVKDFVDTLRPAEWKRLTSISQYFYPQDSAKHGYTNSLDMRYGGYSVNGPGLRVEYEKTVNDIQRLAIKENIESLITSYSRKPFIRDKAFAYMISGFTTAGLITYFAFVLTHAKKPLNFSEVMLLLMSVLYACFMFYILAGWAHRKIVPHFEAVTDKDDSLMKRVGKFIGILFGITGFIGTLIAVFQLFIQK